MRWDPQEKGVGEGSRDEGEGGKDVRMEVTWGRWGGNSIQFMDHFMDKGRG